MKKAGLIAVCASAALLAGCATVTPPIKITEPPVAASRKAALAEDRMAGTSNVTVRSFTMAKNKDGKDVRVEFAGAVCSLDSSEIRAKFVTPANVVVPTFRQRAAFENRGRPSDLRLLCKANGQTIITTHFANNKEVSTATNAGIGGAILTTIVTAAVASSTPWKYPAGLSSEFKNIK